ncbi:hypothetical protein MTR67_011458 [Solanum verrucosum]|uniref:Uncharacterized protein n=1 Tax=Solanum verrucosum TaxID=315347 RepID=A0AAF0Q826_SOLVR|nr:hypothetical protein MTR67_011458 [Solanum verrucosum]
MVMPRVTSNHCPILLQCGEWEKQKSYFKFENWWLEVDENKVVCGELSTKKNNLLAELADIDLAQNTRNLNEDEMMVRATVLVELEKLAKNEEARWRQKSRVLWLKQGDNNTQNFQRMETAHKIQCY